MPQEHVEQAQLHMQRCRTAEQRMRAGIALLESSPDVLTAFRLANAALALQYSWRINPQPPELVWRPFQLGFALLCLESIAKPDSSDREMMDLLWFPTGGGKTEAYLLLAAFTIFLRRLRAAGNPSGAGVTTFMRYTLRLLTIQQFERAAALICACEMVRRGKIKLEKVRLPAHFASDTPIFHPVAGVARRCGGARLWRTFDSDLRTPQRALHLTRTGVGLHMGPGSDREGRHQHGLGLPTRRNHGLVPACTGQDAHHATSRADGADATCAPDPRQ